MHILIISVLVVLLTGCGTTGEAMKMGPDTYSVSASKHGLSGGAPAAQNNALSMANTKCESLNKELLVLNTASSFERPFYNCSLTFRCLSKGDPELTRPSYSKEPDVVIEDKRK